MRFEVSYMSDAVGTFTQTFKYHRCPTSDDFLATALERVGGDTPDLKRIYARRLDCDWMYAVWRKLDLDGAQRSCWLWQHPRQTNQSYS